jgi:hyaluronate lyase
MFDDEIVALGAAITAPAPDSRPVETIVENRKLNADGSNLLTVDGMPKPTSPGWSETMPGVTWMHLRGGAPGSDIGYYFPSPTAVRARRDSRTDRWSSIDTEPPFVDTTAHTRHYQTLWLDHGANPANAGYAYVLLPTQSAADVAAYAARPAVSVLRNDGSGQAVRHDALGLTCVNVWVDGGLRTGDVWSDKKSSIMVRHGGGTIDVSVSDPMFTNTGAINVEVGRAAGWSVRTDPAVTITRLNPAIRFRVNATNLAGRSVRIALAPAPPTLRSSPSFTDGTYRTGSHNTGIRTVELDVTPRAGNIDGVLGLTGSKTVVDAFTKLNMIVRANTSGVFDAMNGPGYRAAAAVPYTGGKTYHVTIRADLNARTYTVHVTPPGGAPVLLASNYAFRSNAPVIADIGQLTLHTAAADQLAVGRLQIY